MKKEELDRAGLFPLLSRSRLAHAVAPLFYNSAPQGSGSCHSQIQREGRRMIGSLLGFEAPEQLERQFVRIIFAFLRRCTSYVCRAPKDQCRPHQASRRDKHYAAPVSISQSASGPEVFPFNVPTTAFDLCDGNYYDVELYVAIANMSVPRARILDLMKVGHHVTNV